MSRIIRFTPEIIDKVRQEFDDRIKSVKLLGGSFSFSKTFETTGDKATLHFTELAMLKMKVIIASTEKEVAWHCVAEREEGNSYLISDILVYPQQVGAATVDMDVEEYGKWKMKGIMSEDERFDHLYAQGHSHVNMAVSPSHTDLEHQREILDMVREDGFYIFMIWNKRDEHNIWIYDLRKNWLFENQDITVEVLEDENGVFRFLRESKPLIKAYVPPAANYGYGAPRGSAYWTGAQTAKKETLSPEPVQNTGGALVRTAASDAQDRKKVRAAVARSSSCDYGYDDDENDPKSPFFVSDNYSYYGME